MDFRERIIRTFEHKSVDKIVWQPRFGYWFNNYVAKATEENYSEYEKYVPKEYIELDTMEISDDLNSSIRYPGESLSIGLFHNNYMTDAQIKTKSTPLEGGGTERFIETPQGKLSQERRNGYTTKHLVKKIEDLKVAKYLVENTDFNFNIHGYNLAEEIMEPDYGLVCSYYFRSPYQQLILNWLGFENTIKFLRKYPREMEEFTQVMDKWDRKQYEEVICKTPLKWVNFGENIDHNLSPPPYFKKYLLEYYEDRVKMLKKANIYSHIHIDGSFKDLLPLLADLPFDGIEALTPKPQGDVTLQELHRSVGDSGKILLDIIPATLFMEEFPEQRLIDTTKEILDMFGDQIILGISDELCVGDGRRLKTVSKIVDKFEPNN